MTVRVFLNYRHEDSKHAAGRLGERLGGHFTLYMDVDRIKGGTDFTTVVREAVDKTDVLLAVIGSQWLTTRAKDGGRRIDQPGDWVAEEIEMALHRGTPVIPVLVDGARMPSREDLPPALADLANRQAMRIAHESFAADSTRLIQTIEEMVAAAKTEVVNLWEDPDYPQARSALLQGHWPAAIEGFERVLRRHRQPRVLEQLEQAKRNQLLANLHATAEESATAGRWDEAVNALESIVTLQPSDDIKDSLAKARMKLRISELQNDIRALDKRGEWAAVVAADTELAGLDSDEADPDGLATKARAQLLEAELSAKYARGVEQLDAGNWSAAEATFIALLSRRPDYRDAESLLELVRGQGKPIETPPPVVPPLEPRRSSNGRVVWSILWALLPLLSLGLLIPAPFIHAAIRLRTRPQWLFAALYVALWVAALVAMLESGDPSFWVVLMVIATVHAFVLRPRVFSPEKPVVYPATAPPAVPHFGVVALGIAGSGKTVYLSSMFHTVNVPTLGRSYFLETSASHRIYLSKVFEELSDTAEPWPRGTRTGETRQLDFDCVSFDEGVKHLLFKISYLDYAGELLESEQEAGSTALNDLEERIRAAHGLLGMLDGYRVLQFLRDEPAGRRYFRSSIQPMIGIMAGASCPIHFVLTKWDLIRSFGEPADADDNLRLSLVKEALMETAQLKALVDTHSWAGRVIRLIPVSAVGPGFAQLDKDGRVLKRPDGEVHPTNIEVPLTAILPDLFRQVELSLDAHTRQQVASQAQSRGSGFSMERFLRLPAGAALRQHLQDAIGGPTGQEVVGMFLDWMAGVSTEESQAARNARRKGKQVAASVEAARARVMTQFAEQLRGLDERLPASRLSGR